MRTTSAVGRAAALAAVLIAAVAVVVILLGRGGNGYHVNLLFQNASQLVKGNLIQVSGKPVGKVEEITLTPDGQAEVRAAIDPAFAPLRRGTKAVVRAVSLSGVANRYIDLQLPAANAPKIPNGGTITQADTTTAVDLDQLFNVFGPKQRRDLQGVIRGFATLYTGRRAQANAGLLYANPAVASTTRLFQELDADEPGLRSFINRTANLVGDVRERGTDLSNLVVNLERTTGAIASRRTDLQQAVVQLPDFMRRANTTFVNLRATLDDLDPLVEESKPVARKLRPFLAQLRPLARDARPTLNDLAQLISQPGPNNDLIDATNSNVRVRHIALGAVHANGKQRPGAFPESIRALERSTPELAYAKPYAVDLTAWFDDFSHSGNYDALGSVGRVVLAVNAFAIVNGTLGNPPGVPGPPVPLPILDKILPGVQQKVFQSTLQLNQNNRCPGSSERTIDGANPFIPPLLRPGEPGACDPSQVPLGK